MTTLTEIAQEHQNMNPSNWEGFTDPNGGEWIRMKKKEFAGVIWRPANLEVVEDDQISFDVELLEGPEIPTVPAEHAELFGKMVQAIIIEAIAHSAAEDEALKEQYTKNALEMNDIKPQESGLVGADGNPLV